jgi:gliding motility-associated lipoprotein GldD
MINHFATPFLSRLFVFVLFIFLLSSCGDSEATYSPKPTGYPRLDLPAHQYVLLKDTHPYSFEHSSEAIILPDTFARAEPHWIFVAYPKWGASIQLTYKDIGNDQKKLAALINDAYRLAGKHQFKASGIKEATLKTNSGQTAVILELAGDVPSYMQFYTTDTTKHYLRGALYFNIAEKQDSLAPVIEYVKKDMMHLLNTLQWRQ